MDLNENPFEPNEDDLLLGNEGDDLLYTPTGNELQDSFLLGDDDTSGELSLYQGKGDAIQPTGDASAHEAETHGTSRHPIGEAHQIQAESVEDLFDRPEKNWMCKQGTAWDFLGSKYTHHQAQYANLIDDIRFVQNSDDTLSRESEWICTLTEGPTDADIEDLRNQLFSARAHHGKFTYDERFEPSFAQTKELADYFRFKSNNWNSIKDVKLTIEVREISEESAPRWEILYWKQKFGLPTYYEDPAEPFLDPYTRKILAIDHIMGKLSFREIDYGIRHTNDDAVEKAYDTYRRLEERFSKSLQGPTLPSSTNDERRGSQVQHGPAKAELGESSVDETPDPKDGASSDSTDGWNAYSKYLRTELRKDFTCCKDCVQCTVNPTDDRILVGAHHVVLVRAIISAEYEHSDDERVYGTFRHEVVDRRHVMTDVDDKFGTATYWNDIKFYSGLYQKSRGELEWTWPFPEFRESNISYKLKPRSVEYDGWNNGQIVRCKINRYTTDDEYQALPMPKHFLDKPDEMRGLKWPTGYSGSFDVHMEVVCDTDKAQMQRIQFADDKLVQRFKQIMTDTRGADPVFTIGSILLAIAAKQRDDIRDYQKPRYPPYPKATMKDTMDKESWQNYTSLVNFYRGRDAQVPQKSGKGNRTSSTHGHPMDTGTSNAPHNGQAETRQKSTRGTRSSRDDKAEKSSMDSTDTRSSTNSAQTEKSSSSSTRTSTPSPNKSHTAKSRPRSRDGGRESSPQSRRNVFDRLTDLKEMKREKYSEAAKRSRIQRNYQ